MFTFNEGDFILKKRISLGPILGKDPEEPYIELREPESADLMELLKTIQGEDQADQIRAVVKVLPRVIVDHNLATPDNKKLSHEKVAKFIESKASLTMYVVRQFSEEILFFSMGALAENESAST